MKTLNHFNLEGDAHMVDVGGKIETTRKAVARGYIAMQPETFAVVRNGKAKKGDVLAVARLAAIQAAKKTSDVILLCHPIALTHVDVNFQLDEKNHHIHCEVTTACFGRTGVEMEALTAVSVGLLSIYDMCKGIDRSMTIHDIGLLEKDGGRSGHWQREKSDSLKGTLDSSMKCNF